MPCHEQVDYENPKWMETLGGVDLCAGQLIYFKNNLKSPRYAPLRYATRSVKASKAVFAWPWEFMRHHMPGASENDVQLAIGRSSYPPEPEWNDPEAIKWLEYESEKTRRAFEVFRSIQRRADDVSNNPDLPGWLLDRVRQVYLSHHPAPMFKFKPENGGASWRVDFHKGTPLEFYPETL